jgi:hypothetical protein
MCPVCIANAMLVVAGATSTGGLAAFAMKRFFFQPNRNLRTNETRENENRDVGTENKQERNQS